MVPSVKLAVQRPIIDALPGDEDPTTYDGRPGELMTGSTMVRLFGETRALVVRLFAGAMAMQVVAQLLSTAVLMPVIAGAMYIGWKQMLADDAGPREAPASTIAL